MALKIKLKKASFFIIFLHLILVTNSIATQSSESHENSQNISFNTEQSEKIWTNNPFDHKVFIENKGQFDSVVGHGNTVIRYMGSNEGVEIYFSAQGLMYKFNENQRMNEKEGEYMEKNQEKTEREKIKTAPYYVFMEWIGANPHVKLDGEDTVNYYFTYGNTQDSTGKSSVKALAYKKIIYQNLYPSIDVLYTFSENKKGIKYELILHPGADLSVIKMHYSQINNIAIDPLGNIQISTPLGTIVDHAPVTFYKQNNDVHIGSSFQVNGNMVTFTLQKYDCSKTVVIDPWTTIPTFTGYNAAYDVEYDFKGNVYVYGGQGTPTSFQVIKLNNTGMIQWVYTTTIFLTTPYPGTYGDFTVDPASGSIYIAEAYMPFTGARVIKLNTLGVQVGLFPGNAKLWEMWRIVYNNCTKKLIIGGGNNSLGNAYQAAILDTNLSSITPVNILSTFQSNHDMSLLAIDNSNNCYMATSYNLIMTLFNNVMLKCPAATLLPVAYKVFDNYSFQEVNSVTYINNTVGSTNAMNGMAVSEKYLYTYDGKLIQRWNKNTGILINSSVISPTPFSWGGIAVDDCDNIYVGKQSSVVRYDTNFTVVSTLGVSNTVYDVKLGPGNLLYACGKQFVSAFQLSGINCVTANTLTLTATANAATCSVGSATVTVTGGTGPYTYIWNPGGQTTQTAAGLAPGTYTVTVIDAACIPRMDTAIVTIMPGAGPVANLQSQTNILCNGDSSGSATVIGTGGTAPYTYSWDPAGGNTSTATGLTSGAYTITIADAAGCTITQTVAITQPGAINTTTTVTPSTCTSPTGTATINATGGSPGYTYTWSNGQNTQTVTGLGTGAYTVIVTDNNGCTTTQTIMVTSNNTLSVSISSTQTGCAVNNGTATATPLSGTVPYTYSWNNGQTIPIATGLGAGTYTITITDTSGCTQTQTVAITQISGPTAFASISPNTIAIGASITLTAGGGGIYNWSPSAGLSCVTCSTPVAFPSSTSIYCVTVTDTVTGCSDSACVTVLVKLDCSNAGEIFLPTVFSPNGDNENDVLKIYYGNLKCIKIFNLVIYNRWGEKVFETTNPVAEWDGSCKGKIENTAVFVYYLETAFTNGEKINRKGNIGLMR